MIEKLVIIRLKLPNKLACTKKHAQDAIPIFRKLTRLFCDRLTIIDIKPIQPKISISTN